MSKKIEERLADLEKEISYLRGSIDTLLKREGNAMVLKSKESQTSLVDVMFGSIRSAIEMRKKRDMDFKKIIDTNPITSYFSGGDSEYFSKEKLLERFTTLDALMISLPSDFEDDETKGFAGFFESEISVTKVVKALMNDAINSGKFSKESPEVIQLSQMLESIKTIF